MRQVWWSSTFIVLVGTGGGGCATAPRAPAIEPAQQIADGPPEVRSPKDTQAPFPARAGAVPRLPLSVTPGVPPSINDLNLSRLPNSAVDVDTMVAHFIDVGQGDAALLEFQCGAVLIDTGGESTSEVSGPERLGTYLDEFFLRRPDLARTLDLVVLSHPHADHTAGVAYLLEASPSITIRNVVDNGAVDKGSGMPKQRALQAYAVESGAGYVGLAESDIPTVAGVSNEVIDPIDCRGAGGIDPKITGIWGRVDLNATWANNANNDSVVLRVDFGEASFLFTGDLEEEGIEAMLHAYSPDLSILDVDVLKVGHHGSKNGTTVTLLEVVTPTMAVAQAGDSTLSQARFSAYSFAHPHQKAVAMLTDQTNGGVSASRPSKHVRVGVKGRSVDNPPVFESILLDRAVYSNGWDGNIAVRARADGSLDVELGY